jgi:hypothetical protein
LVPEKERSRSVSISEGVNEAVALLSRAGGRLRAALKFAGDRSVPSMDNILSAGPDKLVIGRRMRASGKIGWRAVILALDRWSAFGDGRKNTELPVVFLMKMSFQSRPL